MTNDLQSLSAIGGTNFSTPILELIKIIKSEKDRKTINSLVVVFLTDGQNATNDKPVADAALKEL